MKKILLSLLALSSGITVINAQTQKISFETSEGYVLGNLPTQQGWAAWGGVPAANAKVVNSNATDGVNSLNVTSPGTLEDTCGFEKNIASLVTGNDTEISFDYKFAGLDGSDYEMAIYNDGVDYYYTAALRINYLTGVLSYRIAAPTASFANGPTLAPNVWHNIKIVMKKSSNVLEYYANGVLLYTGSMGTYKNAQIIDFVYDDYGTGFSVDNIKVTNITNLSTSDVSKKEVINIYPNPVVDKLFINSDKKIESVVIFDAKGSVVKKENNLNSNSVNVSDLISGAYVIKVSTGESVLTKKFIKK